MKKNVLILINTGLIYYGGLTTVVMNYYRNMDSSQFHIDFSSYNDPDDKTLKEIEQKNGHYYKLPFRGKNIIPYYHALKKLCRGYDVVHVNGNSTTMAIELIAAKHAGVKYRIAHCHTSKPGHPLLNYLLKRPFKNSFTSAVACSDKAGNWIFGKDNFLVLPNAIDIQKFFPDSEMRDSFRQKLVIENKFVLGHVGKLNEGKNHKFIFKVFIELCKSNPDSVLLLVGDGPLKKELINIASQNGILSKIIFAGMVSNVNDYLQAMDAFIFPSFFEGLPLSVVEAQAAGKRCYISDTVTKEVGITKNTKFISIQDSPSKWAKLIYEDSIIPYDFKEDYMLLKRSNFNIKRVANKLSDIYKG